MAVSYKPSPTTVELVSGTCLVSPVELSSGQLMLLAGYSELLSRWNKTFRFSRFRSVDSIVHGLVAPSLALAALLPDSGELIDIGSGPGIPGVPLAIAKPGLRVTCLDSKLEATEFVEECRRSLPLDNLRTLNGRAEKLAHEEGLRAAFDMCTSRALASLPTALELASAFVRQEGKVLIQCPGRVGSSLENNSRQILQLGLIFDRVGAICTTDVVYFSTWRKVASTPSVFPRNWPKIRKQPLR